MSSIEFKIEKKLKKGLGRAGVLKTPHGDILTPAFVSVGTKATVKAITPEQLKELGAQVVLANTYHLHLQPGEALIKKAGGLGKFMHWDGPTMTDSGGFQAFSLGAAFGKSLSKVSGGNKDESRIKFSPALMEVSQGLPLAKVDEDGVTFKSIIDGSLKRFTPEKSIQIQQAIGADIIFTFEEISDRGDGSYASLGCSLSRRA
jgi:queuine tRNA-ribosyltransferase